MSTPTGDNQGYGQNPYPEGQYGGGAPAQAPRNGLGIAALVLGILGLVLTITFVLFWLGGLLGLLAIVFGILGMSRAKKGQATNRGVAIGGLVTGILALLGALVITAITVIFVSAGGGDLISCIQQAGQDQAAQQQCAEQFSQQVGQGN